MNTLDAEQAVLGAVLSGYSTSMLGLTPEDFHQPVHGQVWAACTALADAGYSPDPVQVMDRLDGVRLPESPGVFLHSLIEACPMSVNAPHYAGIVRRAADLRRVDEAAQRIHQMATEPGADPDQVSEQARAMFDTTSSRVGDTIRTLIDLMPGVIDRVQNGAGSGIPTPWPDLTQKIHGLHPGRVYVIGARPAVGKSIVCQNLAVHAAERGGALVASMEMSEEEIGMRMLAQRSMVDLTRLQTGHLEERDWDAVARANTKLPAHLVVDETPRQSLAHIRRKARQMRRHHPLDLIVIDYLQLMQPTDRKAPREQQVAELSRGLKLMAKELKVPIVVLAQLNRGPEQRTDRKPLMSDLRESGAIEADADVVVLLHRDDEKPWEIQFLVVKNRHGPIGVIDLDIYGHISTIRTPGDAA